MTKSYDIFADAGVALGGFAFTIGSLLHQEPRLEHDGSEEHYSFVIGGTELRLREDHGYESDRLLLLEDYRFHLSVEEANSPDLENSLAQKLFDELAETNGFRLLLVRDLQDKLQDYEPEPRLPIRRYPSHSRYVALFVDAKEGLFAFAHQVEDALQIQLKRVHSRAGTASHITADDPDSTLISTCIYKEALWLEYEDSRLRIIVRNISNTSVTSVHPTIPGRRTYNYYVTIFGISADWDEREPLRDDAAKRLFAQLKQKQHSLLLVSDTNTKLDEHIYTPTDD